MAKNPSEIPPQTPSPADTGKEEAQKLYEEEITALKKSLKEARERIHLDQIKNEKKRKETYEKVIKPIEEEIAAKEAEMRRALSDGVVKAQEKEASTIEGLREREQERRAQKEAKKQKKKDERGKGKGVSLEELRKKQFPQAPEEKEIDEERPKKQLEIEALEEVLEDQEKEKMKREKETAKLIKEAEERDIRERKEREEGSQEAWAPKEEAQEEERQEHFHILEVPEEEFAPLSRAATPKEKKESMRARKERMLKTAVENLARNYEEARSNEGKLKHVLEGATYLRAALEAGDFQGVRNTDDGREAERLYREISDTIRNLQNRKAAKVKASALSTPIQEAVEPPPNGIIEEPILSQETPQEQESQTPIEAEDLAGQTREERIAAFRARREELARKEVGKRPYEISQELADFDTAEHYHFDTKEIDKAIEEAKQTQTRGERSYQNKVKTIAMLERVKALIEKEIAAPEGPEPAPIEEPEPVASLEAPLTEPEPAAEKIKTETPAEEDRNALKRKLFPEQFREPRKEDENPKEDHPLAGAEITPETRQAFEELLGKKSAEEKEEKQPQAEQIIEAKEETKQESPASPELQRGEPEMKAAIDELIWMEKTENPRVRQAAAAVVEARKAMPEAYRTHIHRKTADATARETADRNEKTYEDALSRLTHIMLEEKRGTLQGTEQENANALRDYARLLFWDITFEEGGRLAHAREQYVSSEKAGLLRAMGEGYINFWKGAEKRFGKQGARAIRIMSSAAVMTGVGLSFGALTLGAAPFYAARRVATSYYMFFPMWGITTAFRRASDATLNKLENNALENIRKDKRAAFSKEMEHFDRIEDMVRFITEQGGEDLRARFDKIARNKKYGARTAMAAGVLLNIAAGRALGQTLVEITGVPAGSPIIKDVETLPSDTKGSAGIAGISPEEFSRGKLSPHQSLEEVIERIKKAPVETLKEAAHGAGYHASGMSPEDIAKLDAAAETAGKEGIITIGKGSNIWETSRKFIGHGITEEEWRKAYANSFAEIGGKKVPLSEVGFVKPGMQLASVDGVGGKEFLLRDFGNEAGTNNKLWEALVAEGKIKAGESVPPQYQWLEKARGIEHHAPSPGEQAAHVAALAEARPAMTKETLEEMMRERAAGGATLKEFLGNHNAYMKDFESASLSDQEATIADIERGFEHVHRAAQLETMYRPEIRDELFGFEKQSGLLLKDLQDNPAYLEHVKAWGTFKHAWEVDGGFTGGKERLFDHMMNRWTVEKYLDTVRKMQKGLFDPRAGDSLEQHIDIHRNGFLGLSQEVIKKINETKPSLKTNFGRFLKNTL